MLMNCKYININNTLLLTNIRLRRDNRSDQKKNYVLFNKTKNNFKKYCLEIVPFYKTS